MEPCYRPDMADDDTGGILAHDHRSARRQAMNPTERARDDAMRAEPVTFQPPTLAGLLAALTTLVEQGSGDEPTVGVVLRRVGGDGPWGLG